MSAPRGARPGSLRAWIVGAIVASVTASGLLLAALSFAQFERVYNRHNEARFALVMDDLEQAVERFLALGLQLATMEELAGILERARALNPELRRIAVADASGRQVASVEAAGAEGERRLTLSTTLEDGSGLHAGRLELVYARLGIRGQGGLLAEFLGQIALLLVPAGLLTGALCWIVLGRLRRRIVEAAEAVEAAAAGGRPPEGGDALDPRLGEAMLRLAEARAIADGARDGAGGGRAA